MHVSLKLVLVFIIIGIRENYCQDSQKYNDVFGTNFPYFSKCFFEQNSKFVFSNVNIKALYSSEYPPYS